MATIANKLPELLYEKGKREKRLKPNGKINLSHIQRELDEMGLTMTYSVMHDWVRGTILRVDLEVLARWCAYLECGVGDILVYASEDE